MGCFVLKSRAGTLTWVLYHKGKRWWESSGVAADDLEGRRKVDALCELVKASMKTGTFEADYPRFFPHGNRIERYAPRPTQTMSVTKFGELLVNERKAEYRPRYTAALKSAMKHWITPAIGHLALGSITRTHVMALRAKIIEGGRKPKTAKNVIAHLQLLLGEAAKRKLVSDNVASDMEWQRQEKRRVDPYTREEVEKLLGYIRAKDVHAWRFVLACADTGARPGEIAGLEWGDVDLQGEGTLHIRRSRVAGHARAPKTEASERTLTPVSVRLLAELREMRPLRADLGDAVFLTVTGVVARQERIYERKFKPAIDALKIRERPRGLYALRHTFISLALSHPDQPANLQWLTEYVGTSAEMIRKHYGRFMRSAGRDPLGWLNAQTGSPKAKGCQPRPRKSANSRGKEKGE